jgi:hypothetical protein
MGGDGDGNEVALMLRRAIAGLLGAGVTFLARSVAPQISRSATISAAAFLCLHACVHGWELTGTMSSMGSVVLRDVATVYLPALLAARLGVGAGRAAPKPVPVKPTGHRPPPNAAARSGSTV